MPKQVEILVAVPKQNAKRYFQHLREQQDFHVRIVTEIQDALDDLSDRDTQTDVFVLNQAFANTNKLINQLRLSYPRLLIILVDEEADFAIPGQADAISTDPFDNDDLAKQIQRLMSDRQLETLRADSLPAVRHFAKKLRNATGIIGKLQAAAAACLEMNYDYVSVYQQQSEEPVRMILKAQDGPRTIKAIAPDKGDQNDLMGWVSKTGQSRIAAPEDDLNHPLVARGRLGAVACVPINISGVRYGVLVACRDIPGTITQENVLMLELVSAQLAAALSKEGAL